MLGGGHVTMDIARGLDARLVDAERLKTLHGSAIAASSDEREMIAFDHVGEHGANRAHASKAQLVRIIRPRIEETLEFLAERLKRAGFPVSPNRRIVLTGGASQLNGMTEAGTPDPRRTGQDWTSYWRRRLNSVSSIACFCRCSRPARLPASGWT